MRVAAVILAGGRGERLGGIVKANLVVAGRPLLHRVSDAIGLHASPVLVAHGALSPDRLNLLPHHVPLGDLATIQAGPLVGLASAVAHCLALAAPPDAIVTIAVDTPFVPSDYVETLVAALGDGESAVIARYGGQDYPTNGIWRLSAVAALPGELAAGTAPRSLRRFATALNAAGLDWPESTSGDPFANVNTPADLASLEIRASTQR